MKKHKFLFLTLGNFTFRKTANWQLAFSFKGTADIP